MEKTQLGTLNIKVANVNYSNAYWKAFVFTKDFEAHVKIPILEIWAFVNIFLIVPIYFLHQL